MPQNSGVTVPPKDDSAAVAIPRRSEIGPNSGIGLPDPPDVTRISPTVLAVASPETVVTVYGDGFWDGISQGLVDGQPRTTVIPDPTDHTVLRVTVTVDDLASAGQRQISVKNTKTSRSVALTVQ